MSPYRRGGYYASARGSRSNASSRTRRTLNIDLVTATGTAVEEQIALPIDTVDNLAVNIWEISVEWNNIEVATKYMAVQVSATEKGAEAYLEDPDVLFKMHHYCATVIGMLPRVYKEKFYPPITVYKKNMYVRGYQDTGNAVTFSIQIAYTTQILSQNESDAILKEFALQ